MGRARLRDLGITVGRMPTGTHNAITDVPGVTVGHSTLIYDMPRVARTGVTVINPRDGDIWLNNASAAIHSFNGNGEMTGSHWINEVGLLMSPIALTNTNQVGLMRDMLIAYEREHYIHGAILPVVAETYDGWLNDIDAFHLDKANLFAAMNDATTGPVREGNVGGGTGMICHDFKGGIGTSSRVVALDGKSYMLGVLVQANYGDRSLLRLDGIPVGKHIPIDEVADPWGDIKETPLRMGSIIVIIATDAPLSAQQCKRLAQRATVGVSRTGSVGHNSSGDIFLAFATGNDLPFDAPTYVNLTMLRHKSQDLFFEAVAEATEESIWNALCMAETMTGYQDRTAYAIPLDRLQAVVERYRALEG
jgi:D-aminopeptidase